MLYLRTQLGTFNASLQIARDQPVVESIHRRSHRRDLPHNFVTGTTVFDHPLDTARLTFDPSQCLQQLRRIPIFHLAQYTPGGMGVFPQRVY